MSLESCLKKSFGDYQNSLNFEIFDIKSNLFRCSEPVIKQHEGETACRHRLILMSTSNNGFLCGLESYEYVLLKEGEKDRHIVYISKIDTTTTKIKGLTGRLIQGYITSLPPSTSVFVFARAQPQYLFAKSAENSSKAVLSDRELVAWWLSALNKVPLECEGWWSVPGIEDESSALVEIGARKRGWKSSEKIKWKYGHSFAPEAEARLVIPQFDDDAKSRFLKNMSAKESVIVSDFWELLAFGEECGSGKITGFFEFRLPDHSVDQLIEKLVPKSDLKNSDFTRFWNKFMSLDFSTEERINQSTEIAKKNLIDIFPNLKLIEITTADNSSNGAAVTTPTTNITINLNADKRPAINMLCGGFIKRKKV